MRLKHRGYIENNKLELYDKELFRSELYKLNGKKVFVIIDEERPKRSTEQNSYYWGVVLKILSDELGYTADELHELLLAKFYGTKELKAKGFTLSVPNKRSSKLNTKEFEEYLEKIRVFAQTDLNITIPLPNEVEN